MQSLNVLTLAPPELWLVWMSTRWRYTIILNSASTHPTHLPVILGLLLSIITAIFFYFYFFTEVNEDRGFQCQKSTLTVLLQVHIENEDSESNLNLQTANLKQQQKLSKKLDILFLNKNTKTSWVSPFLVSWDSDGPKTEPCSTPFITQSNLVKSVKIELLVFGRVLTPSPPRWEVLCVFVQYVLGLCLDRLG